MCIAVREGLTIRALGAATWIPIDRLSAIERSDLGGYAARIFAVGAIRAYALAVGCDAADVAARAGELYDRAPRPAYVLPEGKRWRSRSGRTLAWFAMSAVTAMVMLVSVWTV